jgi:uncharacterized membrane protein YbjE (DUF340 family)
LDGGLSDSATFGYGALGALVSLVIVQALPWGFALMRGADFHLTPRRALGAAIVIAGYMVAGGIVAFLVGSATVPRHAIAYGLGWQGLIGGFLQGRRADDPPPEPA